LENVDAAIIAQREQPEIFHPEVSGMDTLAYDCLPKTINQALGFMLFSQREQAMRLMMDYFRFDQEMAAIVKTARQGMPIKIFKDFLIFENMSYSLEFMKTFSKELARAKGDGIPACDSVMEFVKNKMLPSTTSVAVEEILEKVLIMVMYGSDEVAFKHAACFVRKDYKNTKQLLLLDCKNQKPIVFPKRYADQYQYCDESLNAFDDIEGKGVYYRWDIYCIRRRQVESKLEEHYLFNKMMKMLTGDEKYGKDFKRIGGEKIGKSLTEATEKRKQGKRVKANRNKRRGFFKRPDKSFTQKRRAMSVSAIKRAETESEEEDENSVMQD